MKMIKLKAYNTITKETYNNFKVRVDNNILIADEPNLILLDIDKTIEETMYCDNYNYKELEEFKEKVYKAVNDYMDSEGCSCCEGDSHYEDGEKLKKLIGEDDTKLLLKEVQEQLKQIKR